MSAKEVPEKIRVEKRQFMGKRNAYKEASPFIDSLLGFKDKMIEVANDSGLRSAYLIKDILDMLGFYEDSDEFDEEEDAAEEGGAEEEV